MGKRGNMKILLLKPISDIYYVIQPNLGLGYLATIIRNEGHEVKILDAGKENLTWDKFKEIVKENYDIIGIQMFTHEILDVEKHIKIIRENSDSTIIVGGAHISGLPEKTMKMDIDFGFIGESEIGIREFIKLKKEEYIAANLSHIPNLVWKMEENIIVNKKTQYKNLDDIQYPAWDLMPVNEYPLAPHGSFSRKKIVAPIIATRGCPYKCTFCGGKSVTGIKLRTRSVKNIIDEILFLYDKYKVKEFQIVDDNFTLKNKFVTEFCERIISLNLDLALSLPNGIRIDSLNEELLKLMEKAGFYSFAIGIESGNDRILKIMKKDLDKETIREKIELIKKHTKINITGFFLIGYPGETEEEILETIEFAKSLNIDKASFMFVMPLPGSELWDLYEDKDVNWADFFYYRIVKGFSDIPTERLKRLHKKAVREFYLRPKIILGLIKEIKTLNQIKMILRRFSNIFLARA